MQVKKKYIILFAFVLIIILIIALIANSWRDNVQYSKISITGNYTLSKEDILKFAKLDRDSTINIDDLNLKIIQDRIAKNPEIKKVFVSKEPPSELKIEIIEKRPVALLSVNNELKLIDEELEIFAFKNYRKLYDLPVITGFDMKYLGAKDSLKKQENLKTALFVLMNALKRSKTLFNLISEINISDSSKFVLFSNENSAQFYFPKYKDRSISDLLYQKELVTTLLKFNAFHHQINMKDNIDYVDLRFNGQAVVKYN